MSIRITSAAFEDGKPIPKQFTGDGDDRSPALRWANLPAGTKELAMIVDDPDAPVAEPWVHWVIYKIPGNAPGLDEGAIPTGALEGKNTFGNMGYGGPAPPKGHGVHHYHFKLYAHDAPLQVKAGLDKKALLAAMAGHILSQGELIGTYER